MTRSLHGPAILLVCLTVMVACGDSTDPDPTNGIVGSYVATTFTLDQGGPLIDLLSAGSSLTLTLTGGGTTTGTLFVPASVAGGTDFQADMAGAYQVVGNTVTFQQNADTFVRDATWSIVGTTLTTVFTSGETISVILTKQ